MYDRNLTQEMIKMLDISKRFGGVTALDAVSFTANSGEVHALVGENGAGKSTLMKVLAGAVVKDKGHIYIDGSEVNITNPKEGQDRGISVIYQEFALAKDLSVAENIFIDNLGAGKRIINWKTLEKKARELLEEMGFEDISVNQKVSELTVAYQQVVEICKAISRNAKTIVFDEPTAVLTNREVEKLFNVIDRLKKKGTCIIYISHRLEEIFKICNRITVLKDGQYVATVNTNEIDQNKLVNLMIGRELKDQFPLRNTCVGDEIIRVENLNRGRVLDNVSFNVKAGEVVGFSGLVGAGRTEAMRAVYGADKKDSGTVYINGEQVVIHSPQRAVKLGIGMLPEDRKQQGLLLNLSIIVNGTMSSLHNYCGKTGIINHKKESDRVNEMTKALSLKASSIKCNPSALSGGNQQKVALMKWMLAACKVVIFDEPTRGVDVGAKVEIYKVINSLAEAGIGIIVVSSEMPEIIGMCDRVYVMRNGHVTGELEKGQITEQNLIKLSMEVS